MIIIKDKAVIIPPRAMSLSDTPNLLVIGAKPSDMEPENFHTDIEFKPIPPTQTGLNLLNPAEVQASTLLNPATGETTANPSGQTAVTGFIPVTPRTTYTHRVVSPADDWEAFSVAFYDSEQNFIVPDPLPTGSNLQPGGRIDTPDGARFIRVELYTVTNPAVNHGVFAGTSPNWRFYDPAVIDLTGRYVIELRDAEGNIYTFRGTRDASSAGGNVFLIAETAAETKTNFVEAVQRVAFINENFNIAPSTNVAGTALSSTANIRAKGYGAAYSLQGYAPNDLTESVLSIYNGYAIFPDSLTEGKTSADIKLELYASNRFAVPNHNPAPSNSFVMGERLAELVKTYTGEPVYFDVNQIFAFNTRYNLPAATGLSDAGTASVAMGVIYVNNDIIAYTDRFFSLNGWGRAAERLELNPEYVYNPIAGNVIKLLTSAPAIKWTKGQPAYINFVLGDPTRHSVGYSKPMSLAVSVYTQSGEIIAEGLDREFFNLSTAGVVNTVAFDIGAVLALHPNAGRITAALKTNEGAVVSNAQTFLIQPEKVTVLNCFTFLNRFGGWECVNLEGSTRKELRPSWELTDVPFTPAFSDRLEQVTGAALGTTYTVTGAPVDGLTADWLEQLARSKSVINGEGKAITLESFALPRDENNEGLFIPVVKFKLSDDV